LLGKTPSHPEQGEALKVNTCYIPHSSS
jgi:hypothetical protein